jgi:hypothetical protein
MRRLLPFTALGILVLSATTFAAPAKPREAWATGQIERVDTAANSVVVKQGTHEMTFVLASDAHVMQGKKVLQAADLAGDVGRQVKVRYTTNAGTKLADRIEVSARAVEAPAPAAKK